MHTGSPVSRVLPCLYKELGSIFIKVWSDLSDVVKGKSA